MHRTLRIGTRESQLAVWQATQVQQLLQQNGYTAELVYIKSEGDIDLQTPLYAMGVQGVFTRSLDIALLSNKIDIAVHSMKDVPTQLPEGIVQSAVLKRASYKDLFVHKGDFDAKISDPQSQVIIATSSIRRKAQWLHRYPTHTIENLRGNVNTRLQKVADSNWTGAIFAAAGLERINLRPENSFELDWMLPAPAQGAIMVVCRNNDRESWEACRNFNDEDTALCVKIERDFLKTLMGGCSTPISALAQIENGKVVFKGNIVATDGSAKVEVEKQATVDNADLGVTAAEEILKKGAADIVARLGIRS
ncbi:hydroxymethylbilane synthase [Pinibacter aurantiacus]|uniref:Hydroxymethylbilane synthase n=1 Tax=Pinibacter aurantiacus TaxID=2851599 RepID=A0A9E2S736_9BACT|nr:hydroxymethylbilane synthase [Pinibacter aurantiacus]MBV4357818.1 hydroxymethylbilane synthase [Pinibacter aurantiacus]